MPWCRVRARVSFPLEEYDRREEVGNQGRVGDGCQVIKISKCYKSYVRGWFAKSSALTGRTVVVVRWWPRANVCSTIVFINVFIYLFFCIALLTRHFGISRCGCGVLREKSGLRGCCQTIVAIDYVTSQLPLLVDGNRRVEAFGGADRKGKNFIRLSGQNGRWQLVPSRRRVRRRRRRWRNKRCLRQ